jgi:hypothetical protein
MPDPKVGDWVLPDPELLGKLSTPPQFGQILRVSSREDRELPYTISMRRMQKRTMEINFCDEELICLSLV